MTDKVRVAIHVAAAEMTLVALGALAWKWPLVAGAVEAGGPPSRQILTQLLILFFCPLWSAVYGWRAGGHLASTRPTPSVDYGRWTWFGLLAASLFLVVIQAWVARNFITEAALDRGVMLRVMIAFIGVLFALQGNSFAKVAPPTGVGAPDAGLWGRAALQTGWLMVLVGLATVVAALTLPPPAVRFVVPVALAPLLVNAALKRRALRPRI